MTRTAITIGSTVVGAITLALAPAAGAKLVVADYRFNNTLSSSVAGAAPLTDVGGSNAFATETVRGKSDRVRTFPQGGGLAIDQPGLVPTDNYSVVLAFRFTDAAGFYDRILDTSGEADHGLYQMGGALTFHDTDGENHAGPTGVIQPNEYLEVGFTRSSSDRLAGYANGVQQFSYTDELANEAALIQPDGLRFFIDDAGEEAPGAVARIRLFKRALTATEVRRVFRGCKVPNVKNKTKRVARRKLKRAGCSVGRRTRRFSDSVEKGRVIRQKPRKGARRDFEFGVKLTFSKGPR